MRTEVVFPWLDDIYLEATLESNWGENVEDLKSAAAVVKELKGCSTGSELAEVASKHGINARGLVNDLSKTVAYRPVE